MWSVLSPSIALCVNKNTPSKFYISYTKNRWGDTAVRAVPFLHLTIEKNHVNRLKLCKGDFKWQ